MDTAETKEKTINHGAWVWIAAAAVIFCYGGIGLFGGAIPGVEQLLAWLSSVSGWQIYLAAFVAIMIEGLYFIGSFFPGTTLIIIITILSQLQGFGAFALTIFAIFLGWCVAGAINITMARLYRSQLREVESEDEFVVADQLLTTWFPAFRATYEVAQVVDGGSPLKVFF
ncbi:MAG: hypothetical protein AAFO91_03435, partial [Bacteroidota bacterium]